MSKAYYNEIDPAMAATLRELIKAGLIAPGEVDERSIEDVIPNELAGFTQCHFFAGLGVWSYALRCAGWPDDRPVWTGSCPCQPFSQAGKRKGIADERHLWPAFYWLLRQCRPDVVFGEQVASRDGLAWLDVVQSDLEASGYAVGAVGLCAAGFGAPHIRQRLFFVADTTSKRHQRNGRTRQWWEGLADDGDAGELANANGSGCTRQGQAQPEEWVGDLVPVGRGATNGFWRDAEWIYCRDGKYRAIKPGAFPLAHGVAARVAKLRGIGNAIVAPVAEAFIRAYLEVKTNG